MSIVGIFGRPYIDLEPLLDLAPLAALHEEICLGLAQVPVDYTGGSHRSMGIMPPSRAHEAHGDYGEVLRGMSREEFVRFIALADDPSAFSARLAVGFARGGPRQDAQGAAPRGGQAHVGGRPPLRCWRTCARSPTPLSSVGAGGQCAERLKAGDGRAWGRDGSCGPQAVQGGMAG